MRKIKKKKEKPVILDQWIEIFRKNGKTVSKFYPPNKELEHLRQEMDPPPVLIYRRMNFVHGVPLEYEWTNPTSSLRMLGGLFLQRLSVESWLDVMEQEKVSEDGHVVYAERSEPRPAEFGPCPCDVCTKKREAEDLAA